MRTYFAMERWSEKVALVTGASSGIGAEIVRTLAIKGMKVIAVARRVEKLQELAADIQRRCNAKLHTVKCDVEKEEDILEVFKWAEKHLGGVDVLINNAGVLSLTSLSEESTDKFHQIINVNVIAPAIFSREFIQSVKKRKSSGHIINVSSIAGHIAEMMPVSSSIYPASKYAVRGMAASLRGDLAREKLDIKVTNISPGAVKTDMIGKYADKINPILEDKDIANTIIYILSTPPHVQIWDIIIMPSHNVNEEPLSS